MTAATGAATIDATAVNVDVNLASLTDHGVRAELADQLAGYLTVAVEGRQLAADVREAVGR